MSVGGKGPAARELGSWGVRAVPATGIAGGCILGEGVLVLLYHRAGRGMWDEVYLHGPSIFEALEHCFGGYMDRACKKVVLETFGHLTSTGRVQARGPHAWALAYGAGGFTTKPGVLPPRDAILDRDDWECRYCEADLRSTTPHLDHLFPRSRGGWDDAANVVSTCQQCNLRKGARTPAEWRAVDNQAGWLR